jgi:hypothetical protein
MTQQTRLPTVDKSDERLAIAVLAPHHQQFVVNVFGGPHHSSVITVVQTWQRFKKMVDAR